MSTRSSAAATQRLRARQWRVDARRQQGAPAGQGPSSRLGVDQLLSGDGSGGAVRRLQDERLWPRVRDPADGGVPQRQGRLDQDGVGSSSIVTGTEHSPRRQSRCGDWARRFTLITRAEATAASAHTKQKRARRRRSRARLLSSEQASSIVAKRGRDTRDRGKSDEAINQTGDVVGGEVASRMAASRTGHHRKGHCPDRAGGKRHECLRSAAFRR